MKTLDSFQVIPIPVSKENLPAVYKLKPKEINWILLTEENEVEFSLFYFKRWSCHATICRPRRIGAKGNPS